MRSMSMVHLVLNSRGISSVSGELRLVLHTKLSAFNSAMLDGAGGMLW